MSFGRSVVRSVGRSFGRSVGRSVGRSGGRAVGRSVGWLIVTFVRPSVCLFVFVERVGAVGSGHSGPSNQLTSNWRTSIMILIMPS